LRVSRTQGWKLRLLKSAIENIGVVITEGSTGLTSQRVAFDGFLESAFHSVNLVDCAAKFHKKPAFVKTIP